MRSFCAQPVKEAVAEAVVAENPLVKAGRELPVGIWLMGCTGLIAAMVSVGGYTRLTDSGLSMTSWRPQGNALPGSDEEWQVEFERYQTFPEYQKVHKDMMTLDEFKRIYFIEWFHRMLGRFTGIAFGVPMLGFAALGWLKRPMFVRLGLLFAMGAAQGGVGWWMVKSGLEPQARDDAVPRVSPYRLAAHWTAALALYGATFWQALNLLRPSPEATHVTAEAVRAAKKMRFATIPVALIVATTLLSGPFVAGNRAGHAYNTWPKMLEDWVPPEVVAFYSSNIRENWRQLCENTAVVQFDHRMLAYASVFGCFMLTARSSMLPHLARSPRVLSRLLAGLALAQMGLGIATLIMHVPVQFGVAHQTGGLVVLTHLILLMHSLRIAGAPLMVL